MFFQQSIKKSEDKITNAIILLTSDNDSKKLDFILHLKARGDESFDCTYDYYSFNGKYEKTGDYIKTEWRTDNDFRNIYMTQQVPGYCAWYKGLEGNETIPGNLQKIFDSIDHGATHVLVLNYDSAEKFGQLNKAVGFFRLHEAEARLVDDFLIPSMKHFITSLQTLTEKAAYAEGAKELIVGQQVKLLPQSVIEYIEKKVGFGFKLDDKQPQVG